MYPNVCGLLPQKAGSGISKEKRHEAQSVRGEAWCGMESMERNQLGERHGTESVRGEVWSRISEGRGMERNHEGRGMERNQRGERHGAESVRGEA